MGAKSVAIDWDALEVQQSGPTEFTATVDMTRAQIEEAPAFKTLARKEAERQAEEQMRQQQQQQQGTGVPATGTGTAPTAPE